MERTRILFVDDDPHVLKALRRSMSEMDDEWDLAFCDSGAAALADLARHPADVVVSDMRMPGMDGADLLDEVRKRHPATIRVILSGFAETASVLKTIGPTHIYLAKPCQPQTLHAAITRPLALRRLLADPLLRAAIGNVSNLPSPPDLFLRIDEELRSPRASTASVAALLAQDVAMTAEILKLTNSAFFGLGARITSPLQAVRTLGLETVQTLVLTAGLFRQFGGGGSLVPHLAGLNAFSLSLSRLAEAIAREMEADEATAKAAQCAAMLSSVGCLVFLDHDCRKCEESLAGVRKGMFLAEAERAAFGATHHLVGAYLLGLWGFSDAVVEAVAFADEPGRSPGPGNPVLTAVHAATALGPRFPLLPDGVERSVKLDMAYLAASRQDGRTRRWQKLADDLAGGG